MATKWLTENRAAADTSHPCLLYHPALFAVDLVTGQRSVEIRGDLVDGKSEVLQEARIIQTLYSSLVVETPRITAL
jgi:hypothetical protein